MPLIALTDFTVFITQVTSRSQNPSLHKLCEDIVPLRYARRADPGPHWHPPRAPESVDPGRGFPLGSALRRSSYARDDKNPGELQPRTSASALTTRSTSVSRMRG